MYSEEVKTFVTDDGTRRDMILTVVGNGITRLMVGEDPAADISALLADLGQAMDVCRTYIFEHHLSRENIPVISQRYEWTREGVSTEIDNEFLQDLPCDAPCVTRMIPIFLSNGIFQGDVADFEEAERAVFEAQDILSILLVPIFIRSDWRGFIGFDACRSTREWNSGDIAALRIAAGLVGAVLHRQQIYGQLETSEACFRALLNNMPAVAVQGYKADGVIHYWNKACEDIYGYTAEEAIGSSLVDLIIPPEMRDFVLGAMKEGAKTGELPPPGEHNLMRKGGELVPVLSSHACVAIPGRPIEMFCIDVDLTALKKGEEDLRRLRQHAEYIREHEQKRIARRIHDDFGQRLTTLTMNLTSLRDTLQQQSHEGALLLDTSLTTIEELLTLAKDVSMELRPSVLDHFGLAAALEWAAENLERSGIISVELNLDEELEIPQTIQSSLYRIAQELLTNIIRHADASSIQISLAQTDHSVRLSISDDGIGMVATPLPEISTMGLLGVRETILALDGQIQIESTPEHGTAISVTVPVHQPESEST